MGNDALFAAYEPRDRHPSWAGTVRPAQEGDLDGVAGLSFARDGGEPGDRRERLRRHVGSTSSALFVAVAENAVVGYGLVLPLTFGDATAPDGLYLGGVVVDPGWRRRGIADALTAARITWAWERIDTVWYFANQRNRASIDLHRGHGFVEHTRDFAIPGVTFDNGTGTGVLFRLDRIDARSSG
ncbi:MAG: GNAT family N-acetyltransferase [Nocardioidaceae bacterium]